MNQSFNYIIDGLSSETDELIESDCEPKALPAPGKTAAARRQSGLPKVYPAKRNAASIACRRSGN
jgi:hypothetical protein